MSSIALLDARHSATNGGGTRRSLLVVTPWVYHPYCGNGGGVQCFELLTHLRDLFDIHFISFNVASHSSERGVAALREVCKSVTLVPPPPGVSYVRAAISQIVTGIPKDALGLRSHAMEEAILRVRATANPCVALLQFPHVAQYIDLLGDVPVLMDTQDVHTVSKFRELQRADRPVHKLKRLLSWIAWAQFELKYYARADVLLAISPNDRGVLQSLFPKVPTHLVPVAAGDHLAHNQRGHFVAFIGNFDHPPNRDAVAWLLSKVWPRVLARRPDAQLRIAGPNLPTELQPAPDSNAQVLGFVESLDQFMADARVVVVPYQFGGGIKIKALDALARGCAVVTTSIGAEGLELATETHALVADRAEDFADAIVRVWDDPSLQSQLGSAAQRHIHANFSWQVKLQRLLQAIDSVSSQSHRVATV